MNNNQKTTKHYAKITLAAIAIAAICGMTLNAPAAPKEPLPAPAPPQAFSQGAALAQAYGTLAAADHDYKGHRKDAMKQIEAAAKLLGVSLKGDGKTHEIQGTSDAQLRAAQGLLEQILASVNGADPKGIRKHIEGAIKQISVALSVK